MKRVYLSLLLILTTVAANAQQGIAINGSGTNPDPSAMLDVQSSSKGMLIPRMTSVQRMAITAPATGLLVFDTDSSRFVFFNGAGWNTIPANSAITTTNGLNLSGNTLTSTVNGVSATSNAVSGVSNTAAGNNLSTTVNGVAGDTVQMVGSVGNTSSGNTLSTTVNGVSGSSVPIVNSNNLSLSGGNLTSTVNGVASAPVDLSTAISTTHTASLSGNTITSTVNGVNATTPAVSSVTNNSSGNTLTTSVNSIGASGVTIVNSNGLNLSGSQLTSTVNGVASTPVDLSTAIITTNGLSLTGNTLTSTVNGVNATSNAVSGVSNTSSGNTMTTTVNGVTGSSAPIVNSTSLSLTGGNLTTTVNGVSSAPVDLSTAITTTHSVNSSGNIITSSVNGVADTAQAVNSNGLSLTGSQLTSTVNGIASAPVDLSTAITTTHSVNLSGNTLTSTVNGVTGTSNTVSGVSNTSTGNNLTTSVNGVAAAAVPIVNSNSVNLTGSNLTTTVNGVASAPVDLSTAIITTHSVNLSGNTLTSTVNGVTGTSNTVSGVSNTSTGNNLTTSVNGVAAPAVPIVNSNAVSLTGSNLTTTVNGVASAPVDLSTAITTTNAINTSGNVVTSTVNGITDTAAAVTSNGLNLTGSQLTSTVNGVASSPVDLSTAITTTHDVSMSGNTLTSTVNGVSDTSTAVTSVSIASSGNNMSTSVNGVSSATTPIVNTNGLSLSGSNLTSTVNGVASSPVDLSTAITTTHTINTTGNTVTSTVNGISDTAQAVTSVNTSLSGSSLTTTVNGVSAAPLDLSVIGDNLGNHIATQNIRLNNHWLSNDGDSEGINVSDLGRVGIGIAASASDRFIVSGNATFTSGIVSFNSNWNIQTGADFWLEKSGTRYLTIYGTGGNVGIGTSTPGQRLEVSGTTKTTNLQMTNGATSGYLLQSDASGNGTWVNPTTLSVTETDPQVSSATANKIPKWNGTTLTDGLVYDNGSGIGIGTSTIPTESGLVIGAMNTGDEGGQFQLNAAGSHLTAYHIDNYKSGYRILSGTNTGSSLVRFAIDSSGYVGVGLGASVFATERLQVNGNIKTTDTVKSGKFVMTNGATNGYILQTDASGNASWVSPSGLSVTETDPQVSSATTNKIPKWNGTTLTDGLVYDNGSGIGIGTSTIPSESGLVIGAMNTGDEGGQLQLNAAGSHLTAYHIDNYLSGFRILSGTNTGSSLVRLAIDSSGYVGVGLGASVFATERLQVNGNIKTTDTVKSGKFVMTNGATNGYVLRSDASGNAAWVNPAAISTDTMSLIQDADANTRIRTEAAPNEDKIRFDLGGTERWVMNGYGLEPINTGQSTFIGEGAGAADDGTTNKDVAVGYHALNTSTGSVGNTAIGYSALTNATANSNTAVGYFSAAGISTGTWNVALGQAAMANSTVAAFNTAIGGQSLAAANDSNNVSIGMNTLLNHVGGSYNVAVGNGAGGNNVNGTGNILIGYQAGINELGSNKLYIDNNGTTSPLIFGDFAADSLRINGKVNINGYYTMPSSAGTNGYLLQTNGTGQATWVAPSSLSVTETDPQVSSTTSNMVPKWNGTTLTDGSIFDNGVIGLNTTSPVTQSRMTIQGSLSFTGVDGSFSGGGNRAFADYASGYMRLGTLNGGGAAVNGIEFFGNGTERMRVDPNGYLGVNITSPTERLHVNGNIKAVDTVKTSKFQMTNGATNGYVLQSDASGNAVWVAPSGLTITETDPQVSSSSSNKVPKWNGTTLTDGIITDGGSGISVSGNGNFTTATNAFVLDLNSGSTIGTRLSLVNTSTGGGDYQIVSTGSANGEGAGNLLFSNPSGTVVMEVTGSNRVGIGNTAPTERLDVTGNIKSSDTIKSNRFRLTAGATNGYVLRSDASGNASWVNPTTLSITETDPQVSSVATSQVPRWNGSSLVDGNITDNGNVGIGTASPSQALEVNGNAKVDGFIYAEGASGSSTSLILNQNGTDNFNGISLNRDGDPRWYTGMTDSNSNYIFRRGSTYDDMVITEGGFVGIGTSTPTTTLQVNGGGKMNNITLTNGASSGYVLQSDASGNASWVAPTGLSITETDPQVGSTTTNKVPKWNGTTLTDGTIYDNGVVGINTTSPVTQSKVTVNGSASFTSYDGNWFAGGNRGFVDYLTTGYLRLGALNGGGSAVGGIVFVGNSDEKMIMDGTGHLAIGIDTTIAQSLLAVNGSASFRGSDGNFTLGGNRAFTDYSGGYMRLGTLNGGGAAVNGIQFLGNGTERMRVDPNGYLGINTTSPTERLHVNGNIKAVDTVKTSKFQMTNGATNGYILQTDASGNASWVNPTTLTVTETDPEVSSTTTNKVPKWNGTALIDGSMTDNGTTVTIGSGAFVSPALNVSGYQTISNASGNADLNFNTATRSTIFPNGSNTPTNLNLQIRSKGTGIMELNSDNTGNVQMVSGGGNVMIGSGTPAARLSVITAATSGTGGLIAQMGSSTYQGRIAFYDETATIGPKLEFAAGNTAQITNSGSLAIMPGGRGVGVNQANPSAMLDVNGSFKMGSSGTVLTSVIKSTYTSSLSVVPAGGFLLLTIPVTGAAVGASVSVSPSTDMPTGLVIASSRVSAAGTVTVKIYNATAGAVGIGALDYYVTVIN